MSNKKLLSQLLMGTVAYGTVSAVALPAMAQDTTADTNNTGFEEIYVTARKKQELVTEVPMNIATVGSVEIAKRNLINKEDFFRTIAGAANPGVGGGFGRGQLVLRGLVGANDATPNTTSTFTDGVPFNFGDLYDIERVEVLRGPQGTLYGSNAIGGTVRVITKKPNLDEVEIGASVLFKHENNRDGIETRGYGFVNLPIVDGQLAMRITGSSGTQEGKITNVRNNHNGKATERFIRSQLLWSPEESTRVNLSFVHQRYYSDQHTNVDVQTPSDYYQANLTVNPDAPYGYDVAFSFPECPAGATRPVCLSNGNTLGEADPEFSVWQLVDGNSFRETNLFSLSVEKDNLIDGVDLVYAGSYRKFKNGGLQGAWSQLDANDMFRTWIIDKDGYTEWTHELRLQSADVDSPLEWTVGVYYDATDWNPGDSQWQYHDGDQKTRAIAEYLWGQYWGLGDPTQIGIDMYGDPTKNYNAHTYKYNQKELAFFGELSYTFDLGDAGKLELTGGLRYYDLDDDINTETSGIWVGSEPSTTITKDGESGTRKKFSVNYMPDENFGVFAVYSEGYRAGGNNGNTPPNDCANDENIGSYVDRYKSDSIKNYEVGVKGFVLDRRIQFSAAAYQIDWSGVQASVYMPSCGFSYVANAGTARSKGLEFESTSLVTDSLKLLLNASYTDSKITEDVASLGAKAGDNMTMVPKYNFYVALDQEFTAWGHDASVRLDVSGYGEYKSHFNVLDQDIAPSYEVINLSAGFDVNENARISLHVNNILDEKTVKYRRSRSRSGRSNLNEYYNDERTIAVRLDFRF